MLRPKQIPTLEKCIEQLECFNYEGTLKDFVSGDDASLLWHIEGIVEKRRDVHEKLWDEIGAALSKDLDEQARNDLVYRLQHEFIETNYGEHIEKPLVLFGVAAGMRLCGLGIEEIKERIKWLF